MATPRTRMTIESGNEGRNTVTLECTFSNGDTMAFNFSPPKRVGESIRQLEMRMLEEARQRIQQVLDLG